VSSMATPTAVIGGILGRATRKRFDVRCRVDMAPERRPKELVLPLDAAA
jgi:hypothetical protein